MLRCLLTSNTYTQVLHKASRGCLTVAHCGRAQRVTIRRGLAVPSSNSRNPQLRSSSKPGRSKISHDLAGLVSDRNTLTTSQLPTPHTIKALYQAVRGKQRLHELSSEESSAIIQLFASLSLLSEPSGQSQHPEPAGDVGLFSFHPLAHALHKHHVNVARTHWAFVLTVAKDKQAQDLPLNNSDNYWLMRAALEDAKLIASQGIRDKSLKQSLDRARAYYQHIKFTDELWFIHRLYLNTLLDYGGSEYGDEITLHLGNLIKWNNSLHPRLREILWRVLALPGEVVSNSTKSRFLHILRKRLSKVLDILPMDTRPNTKVSTTKDQPKTYDALAIRDYFVVVLFAHRPGMGTKLRYLREVYPWALFESRAALCAFNDGSHASTEEEDRAAWNNLVLLSLSFTVARKSSGSTTQRTAPEQGLDGGVHSQAQVLGWTVICALAALSSEIQTHSQAWKSDVLPSAEGIQEIARTLWVLWRKEEAWRAGAAARSMPLICSTATSFMELASVSGYSRLAISLVRHISNAIIYPAQLGGESIDQSMLEACAAHFAVLLATRGVGGPPQRSWEGILGSLRYCQLISDTEGPDAVRQSSNVANVMLREYVELDVANAQVLFESASQHGLALDGKTIAAMGKAYAFEGRFNLAMDCLKDNRLTREAAASLLDSLLSNALRLFESMRPEIIRSFVDLFTNTTIRPTNSRLLESFLQVYLQAGYVKESMKIVQMVCKSNPTLLGSHFLSQFARTLMSHRHYKLLGNMLRTTQNLPDRQGPVLRSSRLQYSNHLISRSARIDSREIARSLPFSIYTWPLLRHHLPFHPRFSQRKESKYISLKLSTLVHASGKVDEKVLERAVYLLVNAGRVTAALKLLSKHSPTISTKAGNIIISASLRPKASRSSRRQVRHASARLSQLVKGKGFIPDRVTLNLLMKALLRWKSITPKATLRALFDRLTLSGYPLPDDLSSILSQSGSETTKEQLRPPLYTKASLRGPFGTVTSSSTRDSLPVNLKAFPKHISFTRHTRPLYKMFMKAFKDRGDIEGAQRVAKVLHNVRTSVMQERIVRDEARRLGRIKAGIKRRSASLVASKGGSVKKQTFTSEIPPG